MAWAGLELSATGVARAYAGLLDGLVADEPAEAAGLPVHVTDTLMAGAAQRERVRGRDARLRPAPRAMSTVAVLPVKRLGDAKQRLGDALDAAERRALAEAMVGDVLDALTGAAAVDAIVVVTGEPAALALAARRGRGDGGRPRRRRATCAPLAAAWPGRSSTARARALLVPGDCPALDPGRDRRAAGRRRARTRRRREVVVVPDRHGTGTNALVLAPPDAIDPSFGPGSRARHEDAARAAGARVRVAEPPSLLLDVDTADDLAALRAALGRRAGGAPRTRAVLERLAP